MPPKFCLSYGCSCEDVPVHEYRQDGALFALECAYCGSYYEGWSLKRREVRFLGDLEFADGLNFLGHLVSVPLPPVLPGSFRVESIERRGLL